MDEEPGQGLFVPRVVLDAHLGLHLMKRKGGREEIK